MIVEHPDTTYTDLLGWKISTLIASEMLGFKSSKFPPRLFFLNNYNNSFKIVLIKQYN